MLSRTSRLLVRRSPLASPHVMSCDLADQQTVWQCLPAFGDHAAGCLRHEATYLVKPVADDAVQALVEDVDPAALDDQARWVAARPAKRLQRD